MLSITGTTISLTRGDSAYISLPILCPDGVTPYVVTNNDRVTLQVRTDTVSGSSSTEPELVIDGRITIDENGVPIWSISPEESRIPVGKYKWDVEITLGESGDVTTYNSGTFKITSEVTLP